MNAAGTIRHSTVGTSLGDLLLVADGEAISGLYFDGHRYPPAPASLGDAVDVAADELLSEALHQLQQYLAGDRRSFDLAVSLRGSDLQRRTWALLEDIPYGQTTSYGALAVALGNRSLAQGVGQAVGHNPVSIIVPCHRVVGAGGKLTGYAGGIQRKQQLLDLEAPVDITAGRLF
ncbi:MAG: ogt2 [Glaciihabitans sp.]|nr:ogt2 [Glaciihabitans sp.]